MSTAINSEAVKVRASEKGLDPNASDEAFAAAMMKCQNGSGSCSYTGVCAYGGECFRTEASARRTAINLMKRLAEDQPSDVALWIASAWRPLSPTSPDVRTHADGGEG